MISLVCYNLKATNIYIFSVNDFYNLSQYLFCITELTYRTLDFNAGKIEKSIGTESDLLAVQTKDRSSLYFPMTDAENFDVSTSLGPNQDNSDFYDWCCEFFSENVQ